MSAIQVDPDDRFGRFQLIGWWDQKKLAAAKVLLVGVGAIGNEVLKNLALLGIGRVFIADLDRVENSNLSRSILFRKEDCGRPKVEAAAERARDVYPDLQVQTFHGNVVYDLGMGVYRWADVVIGGLDNREARVAINRSAARTGRIWIDGAIERLEGVARVFDPATGPCYECTMGAVDWKMLEARRSCALLSRDEMELGKVPTTPTSASVVAGVQCQEAVKYLHGHEPIFGKGFVFDGVHHQSYLVEYGRKEDCDGHEYFDPIVETPWRAAATKVGDALERARADLGADAVIELTRDVLASLTCAPCNQAERRFASLGKVSERDGKCPACGAARTPEFLHRIDGRDRDLLDRTFAEIGVPAWDVIGARAGESYVYYEFAGDREVVLGPLGAEEG